MEPSGSVEKKVSKFKRLENITSDSLMIINDIHNFVNILDRIAGTQIPEKENIGEDGKNEEGTLTNLIERQVYNMSKLSQIRDTLQRVMNEFD